MGIKNTTPEIFEIVKAGLIGQIGTHFPSNVICYSLDVIHIVILLSKGKVFNRNFGSAH